MTGNFCYYPPPHTEYGSRKISATTPPPPNAFGQTRFAPQMDVGPYAYDHADTVLTSVMYMMQSLTDLGMTYIHLSPDMQLYIQAMQIKWNEPQAFDKLILRPGVMHIVQNVCGCIGQLMMGSGLADLIGAAFGRVGSIISQEKPWVRAMRSSRMVSSVILQSFLQAGFKTWDEICEYAYHEKARLHPTGRNWVDNLISRLSLFTSCCAPKEREIGSVNSSAFDVSSRTFSSLATTTLQDTSHGIASKWLYYCLPWQRMTYSLEHLSADTRRAAGMQCRPTSSGSRRQYRLGKVD